jgi:hypothetical protein
MNAKTAKKIRQLHKREDRIFTIRLSRDLCAMPMMERFKFCYRVLRMPRVGHA